LIVRNWTGKSVIVLALAASGLAWAGTDPMTVKEIMGQLNKGRESLTPALKRALQARDPQWPEIQKESRTYTDLAQTLGGQTPPAGSAESWAAHTRSYAGHAQELYQAALHRDRAAALAAHAQLSASCKGCHQAHRQ
jgi:hypothetical protein